MKKSIIFIVIALAILFFVNEGQKNAVPAAGKLSFADSLKLGIDSTIRKMFDKKNQVIPTENKPEQVVWRPRFLGDLPPDDLMVSYQAASPFNNFYPQPKRRGFFLHPDVKAGSHLT